jgi:hypothetical protein
MKHIAIIPLIVVAACAHATPAPVNYASKFVEAVMPNAERAPLGPQSVWVIQDKVLAVCTADDKHTTTCHPVANWNEQPKPAPAAAPSAPVPHTPEPVKPATGDGT